MLYDYRVAAYCTDAEYSWIQKQIKNCFLTAPKQM